MKKRDTLLALLALGAAPFAALAQEKMRRIAWFGPGSAGVPSRFFAALQAGLRDYGWEDGRNIALSPHWTEGTPENEDRLARLMLEGNPDLIIAQGSAVPAVYRARPAVPVVFAFSGDPVDAGFAQSYARPGGNMTGTSLLSLELAGKRIELLKEMLPQTRRMGVLTRPEHAGEHRERAVSEDAARKVGVALTYAPIHRAADFDAAFRGIVQARCDSVLVFPDAIMTANGKRIAQFALERRMAAVSGWSSFVDDGFLLSYGPNLIDAYRKVLARYADRVLRGTRPADLPVELPTTVELAINLKTAKTLGIKVPNSILLRADKVVE